MKDISELLAEGLKLTEDGTSSGEDTSKIWLDITALLREAPAEMSIGQMIHGDRFSLFDAMTAVEMMEPKMDAGMIAEPVAKAPDSGDLSMASVIAIMDMLIACEASFYHGQPLSSTLLICIYLHDPKAVRHPYLGPFIRMTLKTCSVVINAIIRAEIAREEDFCPMSFGYSLCEDIDPVSLAKQLKELEDGLISNDDAEYSQALLARLRFRRLFYTALITLDRTLLQSMEIVKKSLVSAQKQLSIIKSTSPLIKSDQSTLIPPGIFDSAFTRHLASNSPPRSTSILAFPRCVDILDTMMAELITLTSIVSLPVHHLLHTPTLSTILDYVAEFSASGPSIISRSFLFLALNLANSVILGKYDVVDLVIGSMLEFGVPKEWLQNWSASSTLTDLIVFLGRTTISFLKIQCLNRSRMRRKIPPLLADLSVVHTCAFEVDEELVIAHPAPYIDKPDDEPRFLRAYVMNCTLSLMTLFLRMGCELDLYSNYDFTEVYWYLDYLFGRQWNTLNHVLNISIKRTKHLASKPPPRATKSKGNTKASKSQPPAVTLPELSPSLLPSHFILNAAHCLTKGFFRYFSALKMLGMITSPPTLFATPDLPFLRRFYPFYLLNNQPTILDHGTFQQMQDFSTVTADNLLLNVLDSFKSAKMMLERSLKTDHPMSAAATADVKNLMRVAIANTIHAQSLKDSIAKDPSTSSILKVDFTTHKYFPIITFSKK